jgi:hypothetical protein
MRKLFAVALLAALAAVVPAAAQTGNVAIGPVYSVQFLGIQSPLQGLGVTGKIPGLAPVFGLNFQIPTQEGTPFFLGVTADWLLYKQPLYEPFNINFYLGPGFYTSLYLANPGDRFDLGLRIPVGINWVPLKFFEAFLEVTPAFGITFQNPIAPAWILQSALGARVWF